jgi:hypothetical protein
MVAVADYYRYFDRLLGRKGDLDKFGKVAMYTKCGGAKIIRGRDPIFKSRVHAAGQAPQTFPYPFLGA